MDFLITIYTMLITDGTSVLRQRLMTFYAFANQLEAELLHVQPHIFILTAVQNYPSAKLLSVNYVHNF